MTDGVAAGQARSDRTNGLLKTKTVSGQRIGGGRLQVRKTGTPEYVMSVLIVEKDHDIHCAGLLREI